jgi:hypothetical protein
MNYKNSDGETYRVTSSACYPISNNGYQIYIDVCYIRASGGEDGLTQYIMEYNVESKKLCIRNKGKHVNITNFVASGRIINPQIVPDLKAKIQTYHDLRITNVVEIEKGSVSSTNGNVATTTE